MKEAEENREADEKRKEEVELRNKAESYLNSINQSLAEKGDSLDPQQKAQTEQLRDELKTALDNNDMDTLRAKIGELEKAAEFMAQQQAGSASQGTTASSSASASSSNDDNVVDADFTEKN